MAKTILKFDFEIDFEILAITSNSPDYKLAWHVNNALYLHLVRTEDHEIVFKNNQRIRVAHFTYETENAVFHLLRNRVLKEDQSAQYLVPELKNVDYFLLIRDDTGESEIVNVKNTLSKIKDVLLIVRVDPEKLKSKENLII